MSEAVCCHIFSDFNAANLVAYLGADAASPMLRPEAHVVATLAAAALMGSSIRSEDVAVVWMQPHRVSDTMAEALEGRTADVARALAHVDEFALGVRALAGRVSSVLVPSWVLPANHRGFGLGALRPESGVKNLLLQMKLRVAEQLADVRNVHLLDADSWMLSAGKTAFNPRLWYMAKIPFANSVFQAAASDIKSALRGIAGEARKLIVLDLDETLWSGLVGEAGWQSLRLGGHDAIGEAYVDFQRLLKALSNRGILLAIASKNDEHVALEALQRHPEMVLRVEDFVARRINWRDKAQNIADMLSELNLGAHSAVFIDDHPVERARVREALPAVLVPEWPTTPLLYPGALLALDCFDAPAVTEEDRVRSQSYGTERERTGTLEAVGSVDDWVRTLDLHVRVAELSETNCPRAAQLLNKTNQMNLSTRRMSEAAFRAWAAHDDAEVWTFRVSDRFGDAGLTGLLSVQREDDTVRIVDFVVSCRVLGRRVEETMLHHAVQYGRAAGLKKVVAIYEPTARNRPCREFLDRCGFTNGDGRAFSWDLSRPYGPPAHVHIDQQTEP